MFFNTLLVSCQINPLYMTPAPLVSRKAGKAQGWQRQLKLFATPRMAGAAKADAADLSDRTLEPQPLALAPEGRWLDAEDGSRALERIGMSQHLTNMLGFDLFQRPFATYPRFAHRSL